MNLSKRLEACLEYANGFNCVADIGTDHALLPIHAVKRGYVSKALAIDNKYGPILLANRNVSKYGVKDRVRVIRSEGIRLIDDEVDVIVISGMGGGMIRNILTESGHRNIKRLILQPNTDSSYVRKTIMQLGYYIVDEIVLFENDQYYEIIVAEKGEATYTDVELDFGPINIQQKPFYFVKKMEKEVEYLNTLIKQIPTKKKKQELQKRIDVINGVIS